MCNSPAVITYNLLHFPFTHHILFAVTSLRKPTREITSPQNESTRKLYLNSHAGGRGGQISPDMFLHQPPEYPINLSQLEKTA